TLPQRKLSSRVGMNGSTCEIVGIAVIIAAQRSVARFEHLSQQLPEMSLELASEVLRSLVRVVSPQNRAVARVERCKERLDKLPLRELCFKLGVRRIKQNFLSPAVDQDARTIRLRRRSDRVLEFPLGPRSIARPIGAYILWRQRRAQSRPNDYNNDVALR